MHAANRPADAAEAGAQIHFRADGQARTMPSNQDHLCIFSVGQ